MRCLEQSDFLRTFKILGDGTIDFFLGAGASIQSGIPTGGNLVWKFKQELYCGETKVSSEAVKDLQSQGVRNRLQKYFDLQGGHPPLWDPDEYSHYFEKCYSSSIAREAYIQATVRDQKPSRGYLCLADLMIRKKIKTIWTTNFDELAESAIHTLCPSLGYKVHSSVNQESATFTGDETFLRIFKLHGDYRYDKIKNTTEELRALEGTIERQFVSNIRNKGLVVIGYSGSDDSIMSVLEQNVENLKYGLVWMIHRGSALNDRVKILMEKACSLNEISCVVEIDGFDDFMHQSYSSISEGSEGNEIIENKWRDFEHRKVPLSFCLETPNYFIKLNALKALESPDCNAFSTDINCWSQLREIIADRNIISALYNGKIYSFEDDNTLQEVFQEHVIGKIEQERFPEKDLHKNDSVYIGMLYKLVLLNLCAIQNVNKCGKNIFYLRNTRQEHNYQYWKYEACEISFGLINGDLFCALVPTVYIENKNMKPIAVREKARIVNAIISKVYNREYNDKLTLWATLLKDQLPNKMTFQKGNYKLVLDTVFLSSNAKNDKWTSLNSYYQEEPALMFDIDDNACVSINQLKGLLKYAPIDTSFLTPAIPQRSSLRISIFSPEEHVGKLLEHLNRLRTASAPKNDRDGFLQPYSGFEQIYKRALDIPTVQETNRCILYSEKAACSKTQGEFAAFLKRGIDRIHVNALDTDVLIIYIPESFKHLREAPVGEGDFNLHDDVKLFAANKSVKVQFIEEKSVKYYDPCKVMWALSTSLYAKAAGVLWHPEVLRTDTAFIGISYACSEQKGISVGCSQLFDCTGTGMRLIMRKIGYQGKGNKNNPYMTTAEARSIMGEIREEYYKSSPTHSLKRIVLHKTTPFNQEEIKGFTQAFEGVEDIELLQIQEFSPWKGIRFGAMPTDGVNGYGMKRGTVVQMSDDCFLLWTHGCVQHADLKGQTDYYKGGRGIPNPLLIKRFYGRATGETLVQEIMMLTKMNWNSGDSLYKVLPVTLDFAKVLSRMAKQTEALYNISYDFRCFM